MKKRVFILGIQDLQKELLLHAIQEKLSAECALVRGVHMVAADSAAPTLILVDAGDDHAGELLTDIKYERKLQPPACVVALYNIATPGATEREGLLRGVRGFFYRSDGIDLLLKGIETLFRGEIWLSRDILTDLAIQNTRAGKGNGVEDAGLTAREVEILARVAIGWTNDEIADRLCISNHTVKTHLYRVFRKINVDNRFQASLWAAKNL
jgi:LuxR family transcriptional regulator of csgAB operon